MELNEYQENIKNYAFYPTELGPFYHVLVISSDLGKISNLLKNNLENKADMTDKERLSIIIYLSNILFTIGSLATDLDFSLEQIAAINISRKQQELEEKISAIERS